MLLVIIIQSEELTHPVLCLMRSTTLTWQGFS
jgi:hypothetical protein